MAEIDLPTLTAILSRVNRANPQLADDEKVRRYILLVVEEGRKLPRKVRAIAPVDLSEV